MKEKISVIVPVYNVDNYLEKCIESIVGQTYTNIEIILVDDGSTDMSGMICDKWKKKDSRIKVIHKKNGGLSDARNAGISAATGAFFSFVDSDDYLELNALEHMLAILIVSNSQISMCNMMRFFEDGSQRPFYIPAEQKEKWDGDKRFLSLCQPSVCNKLFKAELFENIRFPLGKYYEDTYVYHELLYKAKSIALTGETGYWYLSRKESILGSVEYTDRYFDFIEAVYNRAKFLVKKKVQPYGNEACLSLYAAMSNAEKNIVLNDANREEYLKARKYYGEVYSYIRRIREVSMKKKLRLFVLRYFPKLHSKMY